MYYGPGTWWLVKTKVFCWVIRTHGTVAQTGLEPGQEPGKAATTSTEAMSQCMSHEKQAGCSTRQDPYVTFTAPHSPQLENSERER